LYFQTVPGLLELIGVQNVPEEIYSANIFDMMQGLTMIPSLVMAVLSSRAVILWLLNVLLAICVTTATHRLWKDRGKVSQTGMVLVAVI
jgi:hypothetical protein